VKKSPYRLLDQLAEKARFHGIVYLPKKGKPGEYIERLSPEERELIKELKSERKPVQ